MNGLVIVMISATSCEVLENIESELAVLLRVNLRLISFLGLELFTIFNRGSQVPGFFAASHVQLESVEH